jgi:chorismate mutase
MSEMRLPVVRQAVVSVSNPIAELAAFRHAIDGVDEALAGLVASRVCLSHQAQELKVRAGLPILDRARELEIQYRYERRWRGASAVARAILSLCRED